MWRCCRRSRWHRSLRVGSADGDVLAERHHFAGLVDHEDPLLEEALEVVAGLLPLVGLGLGEQKILFELVHLEQLRLLLGHLLSLRLLLLLLLCDEQVELVNGRRGLRSFGVTAHHIGLDLRFRSSPFAAHLQH